MRILIWAEAPGGKRDEVLYGIDSTDKNTEKRSMFLKEHIKEKF